MIGAMAVVVLLVTAAGFGLYGWILKAAPSVFEIEDADELEAATERVAGRGPRQWPKLVGRDW